MMKKEFILDPLWITKGTYLDAEYFNYVLLAAGQKYKQELDDENIDHFEEVLFHILNLNNLAVNGMIFTERFKPITDGNHLEEIRQNLKTLYQPDDGTTEILRNANFVFINILFDYMNLQLDLLEGVKLFHVNPKIHMEKEIFIALNIIGQEEHEIWRYRENSRAILGYTLTKMQNVKLDSEGDSSLEEEVDQLGDPNMQNLSGKKNLLFATIDDPNRDNKTIAKILKDIILLNKGLAKTVNFEPSMIEQLYPVLWMEKIVPFTLDQWIH
jgi:hypothetical protein